MHSIRLGKNIVDLFLISGKKYTYSLDLNLNTDTTHIVQFPRKNSTQLGNLYIQDLTFNLFLTQKKM